MNISPVRPVGTSIIGESRLLLDVAMGYQMIIVQQSISNISLHKVCYLDPVLSLQHDRSWLCTQWG